MDQLRYYSFRVTGGHEDRVKEAIKEEFEQKGLQEHLADIAIPSQSYKAIVKEKIINKQRRMSYILVGLKVDLALNENIKLLIYSVKGVKGVLGEKGFGLNREPVAIDPEEVNYMQGKSAEAKTLKNSLNKQFEIGEVVEIIGGPMAKVSNTATAIKRISHDGKTLTVTVKMFGQDTEVQLSALQVRKII